jgi:hypothetical protein
MAPRSDTESRIPHPSETRSPMFVHDFSVVHLPVSEAIRRFTARITDRTIVPMVRASWEADATVLVQAGMAAPSQVIPRSLRATIGGYRIRNDSAVAAIAWHATGCWLPSLDADLELAAFGPAHSHVHLMGRYDLPDGIDRFSPTGSLVQRVMVVVVRQFLSLVADELARPD